ncbi:hypothetical protein Rs2_12648 [Raphanus sativus]|nr:hypothetical protein Rs2_12648 [Raphanus sativus]
MTGTIEKKGQQSLRYVGLKKGAAKCVRNPRCLMLTSTGHNFNGWKPLSVYDFRSWFVETEGKSYDRVSRTEIAMLGAIVCVGEPKASELQRIPSDVWSAGVFLGNKGLNDVETYELPRLVYVLVRREPRSDHLKKVEEITLLVND